MSDKQSRARIKAARKLKREKNKQIRKNQHPYYVRLGTVKVNVEQLAPDGSYSVPDFVVHGAYESRPFNCKDCGKPQIWTAEQQKWWYEVAKGQVWSRATRCRPCRVAERERKNEARRVQQEGAAAKRSERTVA